MAYSFLTDTNGISTTRHGVGVGGETWLYDHQHLCSFTSKNEDISQQPGKIQRATRRWFYPQTCYSIEFKTAQTAPELSLLFLPLSQRTLDAPSPTTNIYFFWVKGALLWRTSPWLAENISQQRLALRWSGGSGSELRVTRWYSLQNREPRSYELSYQMIG